MTSSGPSYRLFCLLFWLVATWGRAQVPGSIDGLDANIVGSSVLATAVQPDGKIIIAGRFDSVLGVPRGNIARLNADGSLDLGFDPKTNADVLSVAIQRDGKILIGGGFLAVQPHGAANPTARLCLARLNADGSLDESFDPKPDGTIHNVLVQPDGKILLAGEFLGLQPNGAPSQTARQFAARVNEDGSLDTGFNPKPNNHVTNVALQPDGKILLSGLFTTLQPNGAPTATTRQRIARVNADGSLDAGFDLTANNQVYGVAVQPDGKIVVAGVFEGLSSNVGAGGSGGRYVARVNADGSADTSFTPNPNSGVYSVALQADGKILLGGNFDSFQPDGVATPTARKKVARLNADGSLDSAINLDLDDSVTSVALQADGKILLGGFFSTAKAAGASTTMPRKLLARLNNSAALQPLTSPDETQVRWQRAGSAPEVSEVSFEMSIDDGMNWTPLGAGSRVGTTADWRLTGLTLPASGRLRARGFTHGGYQNGTTGWIEKLGTFPSPMPVTKAITNATPSSAVLNGSLNPYGATGVTAQFEWGTSSTQLTNTTPLVAIGSGSTPVVVQATLTSLTRNTIYYYRLRADHPELGTLRGAILNFVASDVHPPEVTSRPATNLVADGATLNASVLPNNLATTVYFEWGTTTGYGSQTAATDVGNGLLPLVTSAELSGLVAGQTYHYRVVAANEAGTVMGDDRTFTPSAGAPQPQDDAVLIDGAANIRVLDNDAGAGGEALTLVGIDPEAPAAHGMAQVVGNLVAYFPNDGMLRDEFGYLVRNAAGKTAKAMVRAYRLSEVRGQYFGVLTNESGTGKVNLEIGPSGAFSMLLTWLGQDYPVKARLDSDRSFVAVFARKNSAPGALLLLEIQFDPFLGQVVAKLTDSVVGGPFVFAVSRGGEADTAVDAVRGQLYTTTIDVPETGSAAPELALHDGPSAAASFAAYRGSGFAVVKIAKNRSARFVGQMPDTAKFSAGSAVSRRTYAFYSALYRIKRRALGSVTGQAVLQSTFELRSSSLTWQREADSRDEIFNGAFNTPAFLNGDRYTPPTRGQLLQIGLELMSGALSNANLDLTLGGLNADVRQALKFVPGSVRMVGANPTRVKLKISPKTGTFAGSFLHDAAQKTTKFSGIFITSPFQIREGRGSFRGLGAGGKVRIAKP